MQETTWPFGKFSGYKISELPDSYLMFAIRNINLEENLKKEVQQEIMLRIEIDTPLSERTKQKIEEYSIEWICNKASQVRRELAKKYHPDKGGSTESMQAINEFHDLLFN